MSNLSSLLISNNSLKNETKSLLRSINENENNDKNIETINSESVKIKLINLQEYKTKKFLDERKNINAWNSNNNQKKDEKKEKKKEKKKETETEKEKEKKIEENNEKKLFRPTPLKQKKEEVVEELFPDLLQSKKTNKSEKEKKKNQIPKKNKKEKADKKKNKEEEEINFPQIEEIQKKNFNIFDVVDIKKDYEPIQRNSDKVLEKYKNKKKFDDSMILCN
ncbi:conserved Plasmodium protein, unknown function [Plasmodium relictum]|uniref:Uncharacterized protein n=1 Tax=Plasmodium relictum TaxID=85471 RepID=A0A1J1H7M6_PLARL|nr:conserved Plasmodium protein, unknown function [Plasmodium relictum]CRG99430.1 conserved Plasmodium protein, unknown function [Plasmodium relictum]